MNCEHYLTSNAIAKSLVIQSLNGKISKIDKQIEYLSERVQYYQARNWTNYITLDPVKLVQNLFGGGDVQKNQLTITDIETKIIGLEDNQNILENQLILEKNNIKKDISEILINIQENISEILLINKKISESITKNKIFLFKYSQGQGTTNQYLSNKQNIDRLEFQLLKAKNNYQIQLSKLNLLLDN